MFYKKYSDDTGTALLSSFVSAVTEYLHKSSIPASYFSQEVPHLWLRRAAAYLRLMSIFSSPSLAKVLQSSINIVEVGYPCVYALNGNCVGRQRQGVVELLYGLLHRPIQHKILCPRLVKSQNIASFPLYFGQQVPEIDI